MDKIKKDYVAIHKAIHNKDVDHVTLGVVRYPILVSHRNNCRYVEYHDVELGIDIQFMQQNKATKSEYAKRAKNGEALTWAIPINVQDKHLSKWMLLTDNSMAE